MKKIILISGKLRTGKNQFAQYLKEEFQKSGLKVSEDLFARSLKDGCKEDFRKLTNVLDNICEEIKAKIGLFVDQRENMIYPDMIDSIDKSVNKLKIKEENWYEDKTDITRNILQLYGTEIFRKRVDENWWVNQVKNRCIASKSDVIIVTDCRFPNEIEGMFCEDYETIVIRIKRDINTQELIASHDSETSLDDWNNWNFIVENNGTLYDLVGSASEIVKSIIEEQVEEYTGLFTRV